jgi:hypothetical protein
VSVVDKGRMTQKHKDALAAGRAEARIVKNFLTALESSRTRQRGRHRSDATIRQRLEEVESELATARALRRLHLLQEKADLEAELGSPDETFSAEFEELRAKFIKVARAYGERKGIAYKTWRQAGVDAQTLREAGIIGSS